jgi:hypothetical protein
MLDKAGLSKFKWKDIVVAKINNDDAVLIILIFETMEIGNKLIEEYLSVHPYEFIATINDETRRYSFTLNFLNSEFGIRYDSTITLESYAPISWLGNGDPAFISNGIWQNIKNEKGRQYIYNPDILPIDDEMKSISLEEGIEKAFSKATRIEFWPSTREDEPEMVILVFDKRQAITAYNNLNDIASIKTTFLKLIDADTMNISFVDAVEDFHISVPELQYDKKQLKAFKDSIGKNHSFAFLLGLDNPGADRPILLQTTHDFKIITVAGHI